MRYADCQFMFSLETYKRKKKAVEFYKGKRRKKTKQKDNPDKEKQTKEIFI